MSYGRLEYPITVPVGGWTGTIDVGGGAVGWTVAAGDYYPSALLAELETQLSAAAGEQIKVTALFGELGTGLVTIDRTAAGNVTIVFTSVDLAGALGFSLTTLTGANNYTGPSGCNGVWLADSPIKPDFGIGDEGDLRATMVIVANDLGYVKTIAGNARRENGYTWSHVSIARARESAESGALCFERWFKECVQTDSAVTWFEVGQPVRVYEDASDTDYLTYNLVHDGATGMKQVDPMWNGLWEIAIKGYRTPGT